MPALCPLRQVVHHHGLAPEDPSWITPKHYANPLLCKISAIPPATSCFLILWCPYPPSSKPALSWSVSFSGSHCPHPLWSENNFKNSEINNEFEIVLPSKRRDEIPTTPLEQSLAPPSSVSSACASRCHLLVSHPMECWSIAVRLSAQTMLIWLYNITHGVQVVMLKLSHAKKLKRCNFSNDKCKCIRT